MKGKKKGKKEKTREKNIRQLTVTSTTYYSIEQQRQRLFNQLLSISFRIRMLYLFLQNYRLLLSVMFRGFRLLLQNTIFLQRRSVTRVCNEMSLEIIEFVNINC